MSYTNWGFEFTGIWGQGGTTNPAQGGGGQGTTYSTYGSSGGLTFYTGNMTQEMMNQQAMEQQALMKKWAEIIQRQNLEVMVKSELYSVMKWVDAAEFKGV